MLQFVPLTVAQVRRETPESVSVAFDIPATHESTFQFAAGQFLTLRTHVRGEELRRSYSLCIAPSEWQQTKQLRVAIKEVPGGKFSTFINRELSAGMQIDVLPPDGRFTPIIDPANEKHYLAFAGGSGITPILSIAASVLEAEPKSRFTLVYGNRSVSSIMFIETIAALKDRYLSRLVLHHVLSDEPQEVALHHGLLNEAKCREFLSLIERVDEVFICGPDPMMDAAERACIAHRIPTAHIKIERFGVPMPSSAQLAAATPVGEHKAIALDIIADGKQRRIPIRANQSVLEAGLAAGLPLPYACKAGVCCTCKAKVLQGSVQMQRNFTLTEQEQRQGFVLTCQSLCTSDALTVSYDER
jgi:ring-1,2-phenylacetyl-CoA epoxidase subunit PaaE